MIIFLTVKIFKNNILNIWNYQIDDYLRPKLRKLVFLVLIQYLYIIENMLNYSGENIVLLTGQSLNSGSIGEKWFVTNQLLKFEDIIDGKTVITPVVTIIHTEGLKFQILNNQFVIFIEKLNDEISIKKAMEIIQKIIKDKVLTPVIAIGFNFHYITEGLKSTEEVTTKLSFNSKNAFHSFLNKQENKRFGSYTSMDFLNSRLRIDIKPHQKEGENPENLETLNASFNFSLNISEETDSQEIGTFLSNFESFKEHSFKSVEIINGIIK